MHRLHYTQENRKAWPYIVTAPPANLPLTLSEVKEHLRIGGDISVTSLTRSGSTVTATTSVNHNLADGVSTTVSGANETEYNGTFTVTVTGVNTFTYEIVGTPTTPATGTIIVSTDISQDTYLTILIEAVTEYAEQYTKRDFITRTYETFRDSFHNNLEIRRNPSITISTVEYLVDNVLTTVSTDIYFLIDSNTFPHLSLKVNQLWPTDEDDREQSVKITFTVGYGDDSTDVPESLRIGMLQHIAALYENRGDCGENRVSGSTSGSVQKLLPVDAQLIYGIYRIRNI